MFTFTLQLCGHQLKTKLYTLYLTDLSFCYKSLELSGATRKALLLKLEQNEYFVAFKPTTFLSPVLSCQEIPST